MNDNFCHATTQYEKVNGKWLHIHSPASWKAVLANGSYDVTVTVGEGTYHPSAVKHSVQVEGVTVHDRVSTTVKNPFRTASATVQVTDGSLDLTFLGGTKTKVVSVEVLPVAKGAADPEATLLEPTSTVPMAPVDGDGDGAQDTDPQTTTTTTSEADAPAETAVGTESDGLLGPSVTCSILDARPPTPPPLVQESCLP